MDKPRRPKHGPVYTAPADKDKAKQPKAPKPPRPEVERHFPVKKLSKEHLRFFKGLLCKLEPIFKAKKTTLEEFVKKTTNWTPWDVDNSEHFLPTPYKPPANKKSVPVTSIVKKVEETDIVFKRGASIHWRPGNFLLRQIIFMNKDTYRELIKQIRPKHAAILVDCFQKAGFRFLEVLDEDTNVHTLVEHSRLCEKFMQGLREKTFSVNSLVLPSLLADPDFQSVPPGRTDGYRPVGLLHQRMQEKGKTKYKTKKSVKEKSPIAICPSPSKQEKQSPINPKSKQEKQSPANAKSKQEKQSPTNAKPKQVLMKSKNGKTAKQVKPPVVEEFSVEAKLRVKEQMKTIGDKPDLTSMSTAIALPLPVVTPLPSVAVPSAVPSAAPSQTGTEKKVVTLPAQRALEGFFKAKGCSSLEEFMMGARLEVLVQFQRGGASKTVQLSRCAYTTVVDTSDIIIGLLSPDHSLPGNWLFRQIVVKNEDYFRTEVVNQESATRAASALVAYFVNFGFRFVEVAHERSAYREVDRYHVERIFQQAFLELSQNLKRTEFVKRKRDAEVGDAAKRPRTLINGATSFVTPPKMPDPKELMKYWNEKREKEESLNDKRALLLSFEESYRDCKRYALDVLENHSVDDEQIMRFPMDTESENMARMLHPCTLRRMKSERPLPLPAFFDDTNHYN
eukprot:scaffold6899_cov183-Amphora_coffeaeformis.AAC.44